MSTADHKQQVQLAKADQALYGLLESLLAEVPAEDVQTKDKKVLNKVEPLPLELDVVEPQQELRQKLDTSTLGEKKQEYPSWARGDFSALLFSVGGLRMAVPLILLNGITRQPENISQLPGQPDWHLGVTSHRDEKLVVVDLMRLLKLKVVEAQKRADGYLLVVGDGRFGLHCDAIETPVKLTASDVKWSQNKEKTPWLEGVLPEQMCALVNIETIESALV